MSLQFLLSTASQDSVREVVNIIKTEQSSHPDDQFFYLVPNHIKFESEVRVIEGLSENGKIAAESNVQVLSFSRLAWFFMRNTPEYQKQRISPAGINMLLYQIITDNEDKLVLFNQEVHQPGFLDQLAHQITEFQSGNVMPEDLFRIYENDSASLPNDLQDKIQDFSIIYTQFQKVINENYFDSHNGLNLLSEYLDTQDISHFHFYINGFSRFTAQELKLVETLITKGGSTLVSLNLDKPYPVDKPNPMEFFNVPGRVFNQLYKFASEHKIPYLPVIKASTSRINSDLQKLERYWIESSSLRPISDDQLTDKDSIQIVHAENRYSELDQVANRIRKMVASGQYRYSDFLVVTRNLSNYHNILQPIFDGAEIPYFEDIQRAMSDHPLVELLASLFDIYQPGRKRNYRYDDVMRLLKSELVLPQVDGQPMDIDDYRDAVSLTENLVLKNGYEDYRWLQPEDWQYKWIADEDVHQVLSDKDQEIARKINVIRHLIKDTLPPFFDRLYRAKTNQEAATILFNFLSSCGAISELQHWRDQALNDGDVSRSDQIDQVYRTFCSLLDECVSILGDSEFVPDEFWNLMYSGFSGSEYSMVPSTLDQVVVSESGMVQSANRKVTFIMGATDDNMPAVSTNANLFGDADVSHLQAVLPDDKFVSDSAELQMAFEPFLNYLAYMTPSEKLIFTYANDQTDDTNIKISPYVSRIAAHFEIKEQVVKAIPDVNAPANTYIGTKKSTLHHLVQVSQSAAQTGSNLSAEWQQILRILKMDPQMTFLVGRMLASLNYKNTVTPLQPEIVTGLYGDSLNISISQLESFYKNPYEYFLQYGLKLKERDEFDLSPASTGQFYHEALDEIMKLVNQQKIDLETLDDQAISELVNEVTAKIVEDPNNFAYVVLQSSNRMKYITSQLQKTIKQMIQVTRDQQKRTPMRPRRTELTFGQPGQGNLAGLHYDLSDGKDILVRGRIDRIDSMEIKGKQYFSVIDYKSYDRKFEIPKAYVGVSMQLLTYLDVVRQNLGALSNDELNELAGALYLHIKNSKFKQSDLQKVNGDFEKQLLKDHSFKGILVEDIDLLNEIDRTFSKGEKSSLFLPVKFKKDGTPSKLDALIEPKLLDRFLNHNENLIREAGSRILTGDVSMNPVKMTGMTAMQFTPYKSIMNFDPLLPENNYRNVTIDKNEVLKRLKEDND